MENSPDRHGQTRGGDDETRSALASLARWHSDMMALWGVCDRAACRRARGCRGAPHDCVTRYAWLLPEDAFEGAGILLDAKFEDRSFDFVRDDAPEEIDALLEWIGAVHQANGPRGARIKDKAGR